MSGQGGVEEEGEIRMALLFVAQAPEWMEVSFTENRKLAGFVSRQRVWCSTQNNDHSLG